MLEEKNQNLYSEYGKMAMLLPLHSQAEQAVKHNQRYSFRCKEDGRVYQVTYIQRECLGDIPNSV